MNTLSLLMQPASAVLTSARISGKTTNSGIAQPGPFVVSMEKTIAPDPAIIAAPAGNSTAATLYAALEIAQSQETSATKTESAEQTFIDFMNKSPEELLREQILKELGYTEEQLASMDAKERAKAEEEIRQRLLEKIEEALREDGLDIDVGKASLAQSSLI